MAPDMGSRSAVENRVAPVPAGCSIAPLRGLAGVSEKQAGGRSEALQAPHHGEPNGASGAIGALVSSRPR
jgi:hypothetical protein